MTALAPSRAIPDASHEFGQRSKQESNSAAPVWPIYAAARPRSAIVAVASAPNFVTIRADTPVNDIKAANSAALDLDSQAMLLERRKQP
jgi:hypothetical protein